MGSMISKVSPSGAEAAGGSAEGVALDVTPELREQIKVLSRALALFRLIRLTQWSQVVTNFNNSEVSKVLKLYSNYAGAEGITKAQFQTIPLLQYSPFSERMFDVTDKDGSGRLSLLEFSQLMSTLSERSPKDQKLRLAFEIYDHDNDGRLSLEDVSVTLVKITGGAMSEDEVQQIAAKVLEESGNGSEALTFEDFRKVMTGTEFEKKMSFFR
jgi:serine/threonine-protein phosphatase 2B regulatory subunit